MLSNAKCIISIHGAALANIVYCCENTLVIELRRKYKPFEFYSKIAKNFGLDFKTIELNTVSKDDITKVHSHKANSLDLKIEEDDLMSIIRLLDNL